MVKCSSIVQKMIILYETVPFYFIVDPFQNQNIAFPYCQLLSECPIYLCGVTKQCWQQFLGPENAILQFST